MSSSSLVRERQQEKVLTALRQAQGAELTYDELREEGVEFPATVVSELQSAGVPVERHYSGVRPQLSFWLDPDRDIGPTAAVAPTGPAAAVAPTGPAAAAPAVAPSTAPPPPAPATRTAEAAPLAPVPAAIEAAPAGAAPTRTLDRLPLTPGRLLSAVALLAAAVTVTVLALSSLDSGRSANRLAAHRTGPAAAPARRPVSHRHHGSRVRRHLSHLTSRPASTPAPASAPAPASSATQLEAQGHALLAQGQYGTAIPVLQRALHATGESPSACAQPTTQDCLTYAFALYDLGRALRLSGNSAAAVPILEQRLRINNQRGAVASELRLAQGGASHAPRASATDLEARGHALLQSGQYTSAIPILQEAMQATGENTSACTQPTNQSCLTYAFALYDLGHALRLSGQPAAAVPILEQRLQINNQRAAVAQELHLAQSAAR